MWFLEFSGVRPRGGRVLDVPLDSSSLLCLHRFSWVHADSELLKYPKPVAKGRPDLAAFAALPLPKTSQT
jgi:hypothetical protein